MIYLFDINDTSLLEIKNVVDEFKRNDLIVLLVENKIDLIQQVEESTIIKTLNEGSSKIAFNALCRISTFDPKSIELLKKTLYNEIKNIGVVSDVVISNARHYEALQNALGSLINIGEGLKSQLSGDLISVHINEAIYNLGEISGEITNDELLGNIFNKFCIGK